MGDGPGVLETPSYICAMVFAIFLVVSLVLDKVGFQLWIELSCWAPMMAGKVTLYKYVTLDWSWQAIHKAQHAMSKWKRKGLKVNVLFGKSNCSNPSVWSRWSSNEVPLCTLLLVCLCVGSSSDVHGNEVGMCCRQHLTTLWWKWCFSGSSVLFCLFSRMKSQEFVVSQWVCGLMWVARRGIVQLPLKYWVIEDVSTSDPHLNSWLAAITLVCASLVPKHTKPNHWVMISRIDPCHPCLAKTRDISSKYKDLYSCPFWDNGLHPNAPHEVMYAHSPHGFLLTRW